MEQISLFLQTKFGRTIFLFTLAFGAHMLVLFIKKTSFLLTNKIKNKRSKWNSMTTLGTSILVFTVYFIAIGFILKELGISLTAYVASASVIGLAVGFGTQGVIQDVITGVTIVLSDLIDVGDMVEVNGVTGIVRSINMRFIEIEDQYKAKAYIPNRTVTKVVNFPKGYVSCCVDVELRAKEIENTNLNAEIESIINSYKGQFETVFRGPSSIYTNRKTSSGKNYTRIKFRIWPGRGALIENAFKQELLATLKQHNPDYSDWMISINYEIESKKNGTRTNGK